MKDHTAPGFFLRFVMAQQHYKDNEHIPPFKIQHIDILAEHYFNSLPDITATLSERMAYDYSYTSEWLISDGKGGAFWKV